MMMMMMMMMMMIIFLSLTEQIKLKIPTNRLI